MPRVVAGAAGGRPLAAPPGRGTRPTADRAREGLFSTVASLLGDLDGASVLDLYAGSGAVGLEALSRGAAHVLLVEADARAAATARANARAVGLPGAQVLQARVGPVVTGGPQGPLVTGRALPPYALAFLDPPYVLPDEELGAVVEGLVSGGWLEEGALVVLERATRGGEPVWPAGVEPLRARRYGEGTLWYGRAEPRAVPVRTLQGTDGVGRGTRPRGGTGPDDGPDEGAGRR